MTCQGFGDHRPELPVALGRDAEHPGRRGRRRVGVVITARGRNAMAPLYAARDFRVNVLGRIQPSARAAEEGVALGQEVAIGLEVVGALRPLPSRELSGCILPGTLTRKSLAA